MWDRTQVAGHGAVVLNWKGRFRKEGDIRTNLFIVRVMTPQRSCPERLCMPIQFLSSGCTGLQAEDVSACGRGIVIR